MNVTVGTTFGSRKIVKFISPHPRFGGVWLSVCTCGRHSQLTGYAIVAAIRRGANVCPRCPNTQLRCSVCGDKFMSYRSPRKGVASCSKRKCKNMLVSANHGPRKYFKLCPDCGQVFPTKHAGQARCVGCRVRRNNRIQRASNVRDAERRKLGKVFALLREVL